MFSFKVFELENTFGWYAWGGLAVKMNPYNLSSLGQTKKMSILFENPNIGELQFSQIQYEPFFPLSVKGSFKYFYYRFPDLEMQVSDNLCKFIEREYKSKAKEIQVYTLNNTIRIMHKRYICQ